MSEENKEKATEKEATPEVEALQAEVEKWKNFSRVWEERAKAAKGQAEEPKNETKPMTAEEVQALIRAEREKVQRELVIETARRELSEAAEKAGFSELAEFIDMEKFIGEDGNLSADRLAGFVNNLTKSSKKPSWGYSAPKNERNTQSKGLGRFLAE